MKAKSFSLVATLCFCSCSCCWRAEAFSISQAARHRHRTLVTLLHASGHPINDDAPTRRREVLQRGVAAIGAASFAPSASQAAIVPAPLQTTSGTVRVEEIGSGLDLLSPKPLSYSDVFYPSSMADTKWKVQRVITSVEGDLGQAGLAWKLLGGSDERAFTSKLTEVYESSFVPAPDTMTDAYYEFEGTELHASILDRGYELSSRLGLPSDAVRWNGNAIDYTRDKDASVNLTVVQRKIEPPSESGFGSDEIYRIESSAGGIFAGTNVYRAARVRRRYRRGFDEGSGRRILDCIEIVTTHRVMDGIAGIELPTSTCKSRMRFVQ